MPIPFLPLPGDEDQPDSSSQVAWLRSLRDREALFQIMDGDRRSMQGLEAAEALAYMGDVRGLDHLIAVLNNPGSRLRMEAAEILQQLNHPRGLRALQRQQMETQSSRRGMQREEAYEDLNAATTDQLVAMWHEHDGAALSDLEFEVLESILTERLGRLPRREPATDEGQDIDDDVDPKIQRLWREADVEGLIHILEHDAEARLQLEAAEALADLGHEGALDLLIRALDDEDEERSEAAAEILDWLDLPRGNAALREGGYEFETDGQNLVGSPQAQPPGRVSSQAMPTRQASDWPPTEPRAQSSWASRVPTLPGDFAAPTGQQQGKLSGASYGAIAAGAAGGLIGFLCVFIGLDLLGIRQLPDGLAGWLKPAMVFWLIESIAVGGLGGTFGRRATLAMLTRSGDYVEEQDARIVLGALMSGAGAAIAVGLLRIALRG